MSEQRLKSSLENHLRRWYEMPLDPLDLGDPLATPKMRTALNTFDNTTYPVPCLNCVACFPALCKSRVEVRFAGCTGGSI